jgi:hypothetical protein
MGTQAIESDDTSSVKPDAAIQHLEKAVLESPPETITPVADHVTAKTWLVIFVTFGLSSYAG